MQPLNANKKEEWLDCLWELEHDLGKYLNLPVTWLPEDAAPREVEEAVRAALFETRSSPRGVRSAREIWDGFARECEELLKTASRGEALVRAVDKALAWQDKLQAAPAHRDAVTADFAGVAEAIRALIEEVGGA